MNPIPAIIIPIFKLIMSFVYVIMEPLLFFYAYFISASLARFRNRNKIIWAYTNIKNNSYWAKACKASGYESEGISEHPSMFVNADSDFDKYSTDFTPRIFRFPLLKLIIRLDYKNTLINYSVLTYIIKNTELLCLDFSGGPLRNTLFKYCEAMIYRRAKVRLIGCPYGSDFYRYSKVSDLSIRHTLNIDCRLLGQLENQTERRVMYWSKNFDCILSTMLTDALPVWDILCVSPLCIDTADWAHRTEYSAANGKDNKVRILHLSNHHAYTGSAFVQKVVAELQKEGYLIDFIFPKKKIANSEVNRMLGAADIFIDGIIYTGYGLAAIESMSRGTCTLVNFEQDRLVDVFRRYSYLNECPAVSVSPESLKNQLRLLIENPGLRKELGELSRKYVMKYHSFESFKYWFDPIYKKLVLNESMNLHDIFDPLSDSSYSNMTPLIKSPLNKNKIGFIQENSP